MQILLKSNRRDDSLQVTKTGDILTLNGEVFDFGQMRDGDTLPAISFDSPWFAGDVEKENGELTVTLLLPIPWNYSHEQAFPEPLVSVPDGDVLFPAPLPIDEDGDLPAAAPTEWPKSVGVIDWSQLITAEMKAAAAAAAHLSAMKAELAEKNAEAVVQLARIQDRIDTLGYGIDTGEATEEDEAEQTALLVNLDAWKKYKFALGKVTKAPIWPSSPTWPAVPDIPVIEADPMARSVDLG